MANQELICLEKLREWLDFRMWSLRTFAGKDSIRLDELFGILPDGSPWPPNVALRYFYAQYQIVHISKPDGTDVIGGIFCKQVGYRESVAMDWFLGRIAGEIEWLEKEAVRDAAKHTGGSVAWNPEQLADAGNTGRDYDKYLRNREAVTKQHDVIRKLSGVMYTGFPSPVPSGGMAMNQELEKALVEIKNAAGIAWAALTDPRSYDAEKRVVWLPRELRGSGSIEKLKELLPLHGGCVVGGKVGVTPGPGVFNLWGFFADTVRDARDRALSLLAREDVPAAWLTLDGPKLKAIKTVDDFHEARQAMRETLQSEYRKPADELLQKGKHGLLAARECESAGAASGGAANPPTAAADKKSKPAKEPCERDRKIYTFYVEMKGLDSGVTQERVAKHISAGKIPGLEKVRQYTISNALKRVRKWRKEQGLPDELAKPETIAMNPAKLDLGKRKNMGEQARIRGMKKAGAKAD
ncbi:MAG TPA: hypothetical protein PL033_19580 [Candidatus Brocadiia bacterium]|nr:hypothetical protein [Candidatus Brocadiia bacterium]